MKIKLKLSKINHILQNLVDQLTGAEQPRLYLNGLSHAHVLLNRIPLLREKYRPTPWLSNAHVHLIYFDVVKKKTTKLKYDHIEQLSMPDGGITAIAWYGLHLPQNTPTIVMMHTITGSPESMQELVRDLYAHTGWRIALCIRRGHANLPMPVAKMNLFGSTDDLREQIDFIQKKFPLTELYGVGSSAGTGLLVRYLGEEGENTPLKAAFALCPGYNTETSFHNVHPFYSRMMTKTLFRKFINPYTETWNATGSLTKVLQAKNLFEFEQAYFEMAGYPDYQSYTQATNPIYVFENIKIPLMMLNAEDDPVCHIKNLDPYKELIAKMPNIVVVVTKKGSHCGFYEGIYTKSWATRLMAAYFKQL